MDYKKQYIAVVGVSADPHKYGHKVFRDLVGSGYNAVAINPRAEPVLGHTVYASLQNLPAVPDLVITVVPPAVTATIVEEAHALGVKHIWMQPGSESPEAVEKAKAYGMEATEACFMTLNGIW